MEVSGQPHDPAILLPGKDTPNPFNGRVGLVSQRVYKFSREISLGPTGNQKSFLGDTTNLCYRVMPAIYLYQDQ